MLDPGFRSSSKESAPVESVTTTKVTDWFSGADDWGDDDEEEEEENGNCAEASAAMDRLRLEEEGGEGQVGEAVVPMQQTPSPGERGVVQSRILDGARHLCMRLARLESTLRCV